MNQSNTTSKPSTFFAQSPLVVIEHFKVGPVKIEPNRLVMPYTLIQNGMADTKELIYKYEEKVFDKNNPTDFLQSPPYSYTPLAKPSATPFAPQKVPH